MNWKVPTSAVIILLIALLGFWTYYYVNDTRRLIHKKQAQKLADQGYVKEVSDDGISRYVKRTKGGAVKTRTVKNGTVTAVSVPSAKSSLTATASAGSASPAPSRQTQAHAQHPSQQPANPYTQPTKIHEPTPKQPASRAKLKYKIKVKTKVKTKQLGTNGEKKKVKMTIKGTKTDVGAKQPSRTKEKPYRDQSVAATESHPHPTPVHSDHAQTESHPRPIDKEFLVHSNHTQGHQKDHPISDVSVKYKLKVKVKETTSREKAIKDKTTPKSPAAKTHYEKPGKEGPAGSEMPEKAHHGPKDLQDHPKMERHEAINQVNQHDTSCHNKEHDKPSCFHHKPKKLSSKPSYESSIIKTAKPKPKPVIMYSLKVKYNPKQTNHPNKSCSSPYHKKTITKPSHLPTRSHVSCVKQHHHKPPKKTRHTMKVEDYQHCYHDLYGHKHKVYTHHRKHDTRVSTTHTIKIKKHSIRTNREYEPLVPHNNYDKNLNKLEGSHKMVVPPHVYHQNLHFFIGFKDIRPMGDRIYSGYRYQCWNNVPQDVAFDPKYYGHHRNILIEVPKDPYGHKQPITDRTRVIFCVRLVK